MLISVDGTVNYTSSGTTDDAGKATMRTYGYEGTPVGKYKVIVSKKEESGGRQITDTAGGTMTVGAVMYSFVDLLYADEATSTLEMEVTKTKTQNAVKFDVGAPVKIKLGSSSL
ncbi:MAG: hypothetical protein ACRC46_01420 [Thermoguttaceae bacterium]